MHLVRLQHLPSGKQKKEEKKKGKQKKEEEKTTGVFSPITALSFDIMSSNASCSISSICLGVEPAIGERSLAVFSAPIFYEKNLKKVNIAIHAECMIKKIK
jgi:hypothetical protein